MCTKGSRSCCWFKELHNFGTGKRPRGTLSKYPARIRVTVRLRIRLAWVPAVPMARLQVSKCDMPTIEEHGGYFCVGCKQSWFSLHSLTHHRASPPCAAHAYDWRTWRLLLCWLQTVMVQPSLSNSSQSIPTMRGTDCEREDSSRELRNVYCSNLATGLKFRLPIIPAGTNTLPCKLNMCCMMCIMLKCRKCIPLLVNASHYCFITAHF